MSRGAGPAAPGAALRERLRAGTRAAHDRLEAGLDLLGPATDLARVRAVLQRFAGFHAVWEPALAAALGDAAFSAARTKLPALGADLARLDGARTPPSALPRCAAAVALAATPASTLGALYVVEGSTLGGRVIDRHLGARPWWPREGLRYFDVYGGATAARWHETLARIGAAPASQHAAIVSGANDAFDRLHEWLVLLQR